MSATTPATRGVAKDVPTVASPQSSARPDATGNAVTMLWTNSSSPPGAAMVTGAPTDE